jgi:hypothetical protein
MSAAQITKLAEAYLEEHRSELYAQAAKRAAELSG